MSEDISPLLALKSKLNDFAKEVQPLLADAKLGKVTIVVMANRISVQTEGAKTPSAPIVATQS